MATGCGYTYRDIDDMYMSEAEEMFDFWRDSPPTNHLVAIIARMLGWEPQPRTVDGDPPEMEFELPPEIAEAMARAVGAPVPILSAEGMRERNRQKMLEIAERNTAAMKGAAA